MGILFKTVLKNVFGKPLRTLLVSFSIFVCTMAALFCFDLGSTEKQLVIGLLGDIFGEADLCITSMTIADPDKLPEGLPECDVTVLRTFSETLYIDIDGEYSYVTTDSLAVYGINIDKANEMRIIDVPVLNDDEMVITDKFAEKYEYEVGDVMTLHDKSGEPHDFTIVSIMHDDGKKMIRGNAGIVNENAADMLSMGKPVSGLLMLDVLDDEKIPEAEALLKETFGAESVQSSVMDEETQASLNELLAFLFLLFAIAFLLVIFITVSICHRIVSDRMSFIGTLRSFGLTNGQTARVLLSENVMYALFGSIPGVLLYSAIRGPMLDSMFGMEVIELTMPDISVALLIGVVLGAVLIECLIPLKAVLKALKISIRDIIFDNRDTEYKFSKSSLTIGFIMAVIALLAMFGTGLAPAAVCLITAVTALALLFPLIHKGSMNLMFMIGEKLQNEKISLAAKEAMTRKSTVGSGVLCATSSAMCIIVYIIATSITAINGSNVYNCDTIVECSAQSKYFSFVPYLDGVTDTEYVYNTRDYVYLDHVETEKVTNVYGYPEGGYKYYSGLYDLPDTVEDGTVYVEKNWAKANNKNIGDTLSIMFNPYGVFPIEKDFTIAGFYKIDSAEALKNDFVISQDDYISIFHDYPGYLLVNSSDPEATRDAIKTYAVGNYSMVMTKDEMMKKNDEENASSEKVLKIVIAVALGMTIIGMVSNQLLGFEGRKKECAVMISTSMTKGTLSGILLREMFYTSIASVTAGTAMGVILLQVLKRAVNTSDSLFLPITLDIKMVMTLWIIMILVFTVSVLFPIRNMRKMKLSEQLKYE